MVQQDDNLMTCPSCGKQFQWQPDLAGQYADCKICGESFIVPLTPQASPIVIANLDTTLKTPTQSNTDYELDFSDLTQTTNGPLAKQTPQANEKPSTESISLEPQTDQLNQSQVPPNNININNDDSDIAIDNLDIAIDDLDIAVDDEIMELDDADIVAENDTSPSDIFLNSNAPPSSLSLESKASNDSADEYDLVAIDDSPTSLSPITSASDGGCCPSCNEPMKPSSMMCMSCGFNLSTGRQMNTNVNVSQEDQAKAQSNSSNSRPMTEAGIETAKRVLWEDYHLPFILCGIGLFGALLNAFFLVNLDYQFFVIKEGSPLIRRSMFLVQYVLNNIISLPFIFLGLLFIANLFGTSFGRLTTAVLKIFTISMMLAATDQIYVSMMYKVTEGMPMFGIDYTIRFGVTFTMMWILCAKLLNMEVGETFVLYLFIYILPSIALFFGAMILYTLMT